MKKSLRLFLIVALVMTAMFALPTVASAATMVYDNDQAGWEAAVGDWLTEDFEDGVVGPGISVVSDYGIVYTQGSGNKLWYDQSFPYCLLSELVFNRMGLLLLNPIDFIPATKCFLHRIRLYG